VTIIPFLVIAAVSGTGSLVFRASRGWASVIAVVGLVAMAAVATAMNPGATAEIGGTALTASAWLRLYAILASVVAIGLVLIDATAHH